MRTKLMFAAFGAALMVTSCSQDDVVSVNNENAITFRASTTAASRATTQYDNFTLDNFKVYAYDQDDNTFMSGIEVSKSGSDWTYSGTKYWPNSGSLDFYSFAPASFDGYENKAFKAHTVPAKAEEQIDLLYAFNGDLTKQESAVNVNFRHAFSQIVFKAKMKENCELDIVIDGVQIVNAANTSTGFTFPTTTTKDRFEYEKAESYKSSNVGSWTTPTGAETFTAGIISTTVSSEEKNITRAEGTDDEGNIIPGGALMLLPQTLTAWEPTVNPSPKAEGQTGTYFLVKCSIKDGNTYIWGSAPVEEGKDQDGNVTNPASSGTKYVAIPLSGSWEIGKRYEYTFVFGEGAGYNPDPDPDPEDPKPEPVLVPITFTVNVDDFVPGNNFELSKDWPKTDETGGNTDNN